MNTQQFNETHTIEGRLWRLIPDTDGYYASTSGNVRRINRFGQYTTKGHDEGRTYKSIYKVTSLITESGDVKDRTTHTLVCSAFHGPRPEGLVCNHKNGIKHDNRPDNLEWVTPSENILHAINTGLIDDTTVIFATNVNTGEQKKFNSLRQFSKYHNTHNTGGLNIIVRHQDTPDVYGYTYEIINGEFATKNSKSIIYRDYRNHRAKRRIYIASSLADAAYKTKTKFSLLTGKVNTYMLVNGRCYFEFNGNEPMWPEFKPREVLDSIKEYGRLGSTILCFDPLSGSTYTAEAYLAMSNALKADGITISKDSIHKVLLEDELRLCRGLVFKYLSDSREFPNYERAEVELSRGRDYGRKRYEVKDYKNGKVRSADSLNSLVLEMSVSRSKRLYPKTVSDKIGTLIAGCVFRAVSDALWPSYSESEVKDSLEMFYTNQQAKSSKVILKDYVTGNLHTAKGVTAMYRLLSELRPISISSLEKLYRAKGSKIINGYVIFKESEFTEWPEYSEEEITNSINVSILGTGRATQCTASMNNVILKANTISELHSQLTDLGVSCCKSTVRDRIVKNNLKPLSGWILNKHSVR